MGDTGITIKDGQLLVGEGEVNIEDIAGDCNCCDIFRYARDGTGSGNVQSRNIAGELVSELFIAPTPFIGDCHDVSLGAGSVHYGVAGRQAGKTLPNGISQWSVSFPDVNILHGAALNRDESIMYICGEGKQIPSLGDDLYALDPSDGSITASKRVTGSTSFSIVGDVAVDDAGNVYVVTGEGDLVKFGPGLAGSGTTLFSVVSSVTGRSISSLDVDSGANPDILMVGNDDESGDLLTDRTIWLVDSTGSVIWKQLRGSGNYPAGLSPFGGAALDGAGGAYILASLFTNETIWKFRQSDGVELWSQLTQSSGAKIDSDATHVAGGGSAHSVPGNNAFLVNSSDGSIVFQTALVGFVVHAGRMRVKR